MSGVRAHELEARRAEGEYLRATRIAARISQRVLAVNLGVPRQTISKLEQGALVIDSYLPALIAHVPGFHARDCVSRGLRAALTYVETNVA